MVATFFKLKKLTFEGERYEETKLDIANFRHGEELGSVSVASYPKRALAITEDNANLCNYDKLPVEIVPCSNPGKARVVLRYAVDDELRQLIHMEKRAQELRYNKLVEDLSEKQIGLRQDLAVEAASCNYWEGRVKTFNNMSWLRKMWRVFWYGSV